MKKTEKGFSLLEATIAILIFAILVQLLMNFFYTMYVNGKYFQKQSYLMDNARIVNAFVKEKIREAKSVKIVIDDGSGGEKAYDPVNYDTGKEAYSGQLTRIKFQDEHGDCTGIEMKLGTDAKKGTYVLKYINYSSPLSQPVLITEEIESIMVEHKKDADAVSFKCSYSPQNAQNKDRETVEDTFSESLAYKQKIN